MTRVKDMRDDSLKLNKMLAAFQMMLWYVLAGVAYNEWLSSNDLGAIVFFLLFLLGVAWGTVNYQKSLQIVRESERRGIEWGSNEL